MHPSRRAVPAAALLLLIGKTLAAASPRDESSTTADDGPIDLAFHDPQVADAVQRLAAGRYDEAVALLRDAEGRARSEEQRLGLGMILVRAGRKPEAHAMLSKLERSATDASISGRARLLLRVAKRAVVVSPRADGATRPLASPEGWSGALLDAMQQIGKDLDREHAALGREITAAGWDAVTARVATLHRLMAELDLVIGGQSVAERIGRRHAEAIGRAVDAINRHVDAGILEARRLAQDIRGVRRSNVAQRQALRERRARICDKTLRAWDAGNALVNEYVELQNRKNYRMMFARRVSMNVRRSQLPVE